MQIIRLPLEGTSNTRDIGGYVGSNNRLFRWKKALRSDDMSRLTEKDKEYLINKYNLKKVIDLRSNQELQAAQNVFANDERVKYVNISLADEVDPNKPMDLKDVSDNFFRDFYVDLLENKQNHLKEVLQEIINIGRDESVIFHCTAGKDRTGVTAMLLLGICGISKQDISTNYMQTATNLKYNTFFAESTKKMVEKLKDVLSDEFLRKMSSSDVEFIEYTYDFLIEKYSSFENYFLHIGISKEEINKLIENFTVELN